MTSFLIRNGFYRLSVKFLVGQFMWWLYPRMACCKPGVFVIVDSLIIIVILNVSNIIMFLYCWK